MYARDGSIADDISRYVTMAAGFMLAHVKCTLL